MEDWFAARNGNAAAVEEKNVMTREVSGLVSDTASKYHQSKTDPLMKSSCGASRLKRVLASSVDVDVSSSK